MDDLKGLSESELAAAAEMAKRHGDKGKLTTISAELARRDDALRKRYGRSPEYRRAEARLAAILFVALFSWFLTYLLALRPLIEAALFGHVSSSPSKLHLIPIIVPIVILGIILARRLPPRN